MPEVSEEALLQFTKLNSTIKKLLEHPEARTMVLKAQKIVEPNMIIPELDNPQVKEIEKIKRELEDYKKSQEDARIKAESDEHINRLMKKWNTDKEKLKNKYKYTDEGIKRIEDFCTERGISDIEAGAALFEKVHPPEDIIDGGNSRLSIFDVPTNEGIAKELFETKGQNKHVFNGIIKKTLKEIRSGDR